MTSNSIDALITLIRDGAEYNNNTPAAPIAYVVKNLSNNSVVKLGESTKYNVYEYQESDLNTFNCNLDFKRVFAINDCDESGGDGDFFYNFNIFDSDGNLIENFSTDENNLNDISDGESFELNKNIDFEIFNETNAHFKIEGSIFDSENFGSPVELKFDIRINLELGKDIIETSNNIFYDNNLNEYYFEVKNTGEYCHLRIYFNFTKDK